MSPSHVTIVAGPRDAHARTRVEPPSSWMAELPLACSADRSSAQRSPDWSRAQCSATVRAGKPFEVLYVLLSSEDKEVIPLFDHRVAFGLQDLTSSFNGRHEDASRHHA